MTDKITQRDPGIIDRFGGPRGQEMFRAFLAELEAKLETERLAIQAWATVTRDTLQVVDSDSTEHALSLARLAKARLETLEENRKVFSGPLHQWKVKVDAAYKALTKPLEEVIQVSKARISEHGAKMAQERAKAMQAASAQLQAGIIPTDQIPEPTQAQGLSLKISWRARVVDAALVPRDLCSPDLDLIQERIAYADTAATPPRPIPGLEFDLVTGATIRRV